MPAWLTRLKGIVLAAVILSGGSGLQLLDAVLYHARSAQTSRLGSSIEAPGTPLAHAELCTLGRAAPATQPSPRGDGGTREVPVVLRTQPPLAPAAPRPADLLAVRHSRAPPTHLV